MMKRKMLSVMLAAVLCLGVVGCGSGNKEEAADASAAAEATAADEADTTADDDAASEDAAGDDAVSVDASDVEVAVIFKSLSAEYWKTMKAGSEAAAADLGISVTVLGPSDESEISQQVTMIEEQVAANVSAIVVAPCEENAVIGALEASVEDLPVLMVDSDAALEGKKAFIGTGNATAAKLGGDYAAELVGEGGKAVLIGGQQGETTTEQRLQGFREGLEAGGVEVLEEQYGKNTADQAVAVMEDMITKYRGEIDVVLCINDDMAIGCQTAIEQAGEDIKIIGFNGDAACVELILEGKIEATVAQQPYLMGYQAVEEAYKAVQGETIEEHQEVPANLINAENGEAYLNGEN